MPKPIEIAIGTRKRACVEVSQVIGIISSDGKIYEWCEYYDNEHWSRNGGPSLVL